MIRLRPRLRSVAQTLLVLVVVTFLTFAVFSLWPSDPAALAELVPAGDIGPGFRVHRHRV